MSDRKKLIFFDIDGTLLNHEKELPTSTEKAIERLKADGHFVAIATGRAPFMFKNLREKLALHTYVSFNGQYVESKGEVILKNALNQAELVRLTDFAVRHNHPVVYLDHEDMRANIPYHPYIEKSMGSLKFEHPACDPSYMNGRDLYQALLFCTKDEYEPYINQFNKFDFIQWHELCADILPKGGSKANGIEAVMEKYAIDVEDVYVFGDGPNDVEMLQCTPNSVAMGNAVQETKEVASFVTKHVNDDGIAHGLKHFGLI